MEIFNLTLSQMLMMFMLIIIGFVLKKKNIVPDNAYITISKLETFVFVPALNLGTMLSNCSVTSFVQNSYLILFGLATILCAVAMAYPVSHLFVRNASDSAAKYQRNIYRYALTFGNYGFMGNFIVLGIWGEEMFFKYSMFTLLITVVCTSWGLYVLIPKEQNTSKPLDNIRKGFCTPPFIALLIGMAGGLLGIKSYIPDFALNAISNASSCMGPCAMLLAGVVIGGYDFKSLFNQKKVYGVSLLRLIVIPAVFALVLKFIGASDVVITFTLIAFATPLGLNTIVYPAAYGGDTHTGASMAVISHTIAIITIPVMYLLFVVMM